MLELLPINNQPVEKADRSTDGSLDVHSVFYTIQGEGPFAGCPAVFVRLAGCNLSGPTCTLCDTEYTQGRRRLTVEQLIEKVTDVLPRSVIEITDSKGIKGLVVITGGEPLRQGLGPFVFKLLSWGFEVQIETNGTLYDPTLVKNYGVISVVCSPKTSKISTELLPYITDYKYILGADAISPEDGLPTSSLGGPTPPARPHEGFTGQVYVQPLDEKDEETNRRHVQATVKMCMRFGYRLSYQLHKLLGLE